MSVNAVVPFFAVKDMEKSVAFYIDGLGFEFVNKWVKDDVLRWCHLQIGNAGLMLQQYKTEGHDARQFSDSKGEGVTLCFFCDDAVAFYRDVKARGIDLSEHESTRMINKVDDELKIGSSSASNSFSDRFYNEIVIERHRELI